MTITLPGEIRTCKDGFRALGEVYAESCAREDVVVEFDCAGLRFVDANLCAALGVVFEQIIANGKRIKIIGEIKQEVGEVLRCNNFLPWAIKSDNVTLTNAIAAVINVIPTITKVIAPAITKISADNAASKAIPIANGPDAAPIIPAINANKPTTATIATAAANI